MPEDSDAAAPPRLLFDSHMHTPLCGHAEGDPEAYAAAGFVRGLRGILFTCHSPMPDGWAQRVRMRMDQFDEYVGMVAQTEERAAADGFEVRLGMESDYYPGMEDWLKSLHDRAEFHYVLGSVHYFLDEWANHFDWQADPLDFQRTYFHMLAESAETGLFDCLAHPDLVKNAFPHRNDFPALEADIARALDRIAATGIAMELNTSGARKSVKEFNPKPMMLEMMRGRDIPVVLGSDAHSPWRVGADYIDALDLLESCGYTHLANFENRQRQDLSIAEVRASLQPGVSVSYFDHVEGGSWQQEMELLRYRS